MNTYIKTTITIALCGLCITTMAADTFIVKYKLNESQKSFLSSHGGADANKAEAKIREELMEELSKEQLDTLAKAADVKLAAAKIQVTDSYPLANGAHVITLSEDLDETQTKQFIRNIKQDNNIEYVEEDKELKASSAPDINPTYQWDMAGPGEFSAKPNWSGDGFAKAWTILNKHGYVPGKNVVVAVLDSGYTPHPNFINNLQPLNGQAGVYGYKFISDCRKSGECSACTGNKEAKRNPHSKYTPNGLDLGDFITAEDIKCPYFHGKKEEDVENSSWHGSHVIGTIISNGYSASKQDYMTGGAYGATVVPVRVLGKGGGGKISDITNAMMWAAGLTVPNTDKSPVPVNPNPAQVISMSLGFLDQCSTHFQGIINDVVRKGVVIVVCASNDRVNIKDVTPAGCAEVISVAAKGPTGQLAEYSNFGNTTITASGGDVTISSPLSMVNSTTWSSLEKYQSPSNDGHGTWTEMQGTSMAAPHVSAAVAILIGILKEQGETYTHKEIINILQESAITYKECNVHGCATNYALNVQNAVNRVLAPTPNLPLMDPSSQSQVYIFTLAELMAVAVMAAEIGGTIVYCYLNPRRAN